jgi:uncharacterized membrane protein YjjP (DUF1212 family)
VVVALLVLASAALLLLRGGRRVPGGTIARDVAVGTTAEQVTPVPPAPVEDVPPGLEPPTRVDDPRVPFLVGLGEAMIDSSASVTQVTQSLRRVADVNGLPSAEMIVLSTALMVSVDDGRAVQTAAASAGQSPLRLEQIDAVFDVVDDAERGLTSPEEGLARLREARAMPPAFGPVARVLGYVVMTVGLALVLQGGLPDLVVAAVLGAGVGTAQLVAARFSSVYQAFLMVGCAFVVSLVVLLLARTDLDVGVFAPLIAPLVTFLPGALLTTSVIELSTGQMISGAGRAAAGAMYLLLLALGIVAAAQLVGVPPSNVAEAATLPLGPIAPWVGVAAFGVGIVVHQCARPASLRWILVVLYVAYAGQVIAGVYFGGVLSGFFGALLMTPVAMLVATRPSGPYPQVSFLPAFWLLVPGALGLVGVTQVLGRNQVDGATSLVTTVVTMVGIALGVLLGLIIGSVLASASRRSEPPRMAEEIGDRP